MRRVRIVTVQDDTGELVREALAALGVEDLVLAIHDVSFPSEPSEDIGRGSPYSSGARRFFAFVRGLGFDGVQLGPQGQTSLGNLSPYDGSVFSKNPMSLPARALASEGLCAVERIDRLVASTPAGSARAHHAHAFAAADAVLAGAREALRDGLARGDAAAHALDAEVRAFAARAPWVVHDARFEAFVAQNGTDDFRRWPEADRAPTEAHITRVVTERREAFDGWVLGQALLERAHAALRDQLTGLGLRLYGDLQIGLSLRDRWARDALFFPGYAMGAPPSRTNPEGQPWAYPVLDPRQYRTRDATSPVLAFVRARVAKLLTEFDGVRIDHPHGLVCPWVYDANAPDPLAAVVAGARLFETPAPYAGTASHPALASVAIARPEQIDASVPAYADHRVRDLDDAQVERYSRLFDIVMEEAGERGTILCEVLSTCPEPLARVMARHQLGRFRVTQKASLVDPSDAYRGENATPRDWTMIGNHDTPPILRVIDRWRRAGTIGARADYLAMRLAPDPARREALARWLASDATRLATGMFAELFVGPAAHVLVFWADLFGERDVYNTPGDVAADNWSMRVPRDFEQVYDARVRSGEALDVPSALALALRARGLDGPLCTSLERRARSKPE